MDDTLLSHDRHDSTKHTWQVPSKLARKLTREMTHAVITGMVNSSSPKRYMCLEGDGPGFSNIEFRPQMLRANLKHKDDEVATTSCFGLLGSDETPVMIEVVFPTEIVDKTVDLIVIFHSRPENPAHIALLW